ncbi:hypothetical protein D5S17_23380 [Pseudonocardiaceae bacterium YIM PH 21723]|nr:hypothetical protein D5S17_23380 [Pseudonocardiaceae bacterium YIM PH 21723]
MSALYDDGEYVWDDEGNRVGPTLDGPEPTEPDCGGCEGAGGPCCGEPVSSPGENAMVFSNEPPF